ncbi:hypothetical protein GCK72_020869 [Caenorhabditis remanei]|uniref:CUB-like domain-containing protein n=1 Tax=Caenorhabditis remanei TaxID=31234 RepID=A0A6A5GIS3_CAERE|nr:hypothetical protein GCK72_020869 [Caenorhabditis remanei]KAF1754309.1 hypothetical protein GCK72_020869 [Caenorhabditis remanei]
MLRQLLISSYLLFLSVASQGYNCSGKTVVNPPKDLSEPYYFPNDWNESMPSAKYNQSQDCNWRLIVPNGMYATAIFYRHTNRTGSFTFVYPNDNMALIHDDEFIPFISTSPYFELYMSVKKDPGAFSFKVTWSNYVQLRHSAVFEGDSYNGSYLGNLLDMRNRQIVSNSSQLTVYTFGLSEIYDYVLYMGVDAKEWHPKDLRRKIDNLLTTVNESDYNYKFPMVVKNNVKFYIIDRDARAIIPLNSGDRLSYYTVAPGRIVNIHSFYYRQLSSQQYTNETYTTNSKDVKVYFNLNVKSFDVIGPTYLDISVFRDDQEVFQQRYKETNRPPTTTLRVLGDKITVTYDTLGYNTTGFEINMFCTENDQTTTTRSTTSTSTTAIVTTTTIPTTTQSTTPTTTPTTTTTRRRIITTTRRTIPTTTSTTMKTTTRRIVATTKFSVIHKCSHITCSL